MSETDTTKSAEYLRLIIPLMSKYKTAATPAAYAMWYDYVSGTNVSLKTELDVLLKSQESLSGEQVDALFSKHISECDRETMKRVHADMRRVMSNIAESASQTGNSASQFGRMLEGYGDRLRTDLNSGEVQDIVDGLSGETERMRDSMDSLNNRLAESRSEVDKLRDELRRVKEEAVTDPLTGLLNRKGFSMAMAEATAGDQLCLLILDIDHFKRINDNYGHLLGDKVIQFVGKSLLATVKGKDTASRYGGEEFAVLLPETDLTGAYAVAEQIRSGIEKARIRRMDSKESIGTVTISIGIARYRPGETEAEFIARADEALYCSKNQGRNQVSMEQDVAA